MTEDQLIEKHAEVCNIIWYATHPEWEEDGFMHTSDECRAVAANIFDTLGLI